MVRAVRSRCASCWTIGSVHCAERCWVRSAATSEVPIPFCNQKQARRARRVEPKRAAPSDGAVGSRRREQREQRESNVGRASGTSRANERARKEQTRWSRTTRALARSGHEQRESKAGRATGTSGASEGGTEARVQDKWGERGMSGRAARAARTSGRRRGSGPTPHPPSRPTAHSAVKRLARPTLMRARPACHSQRASVRNDAFVGAREAPLKPAGALTTTPGTSLVTWLVAPS